MGLFKLNWKQASLASFSVHIVFAVGEGSARSQARWSSAEEQPSSPSWDVAAHFCPLENLLHFLFFSLELDPPFCYRVWNSTCFTNNRTDNWGFLFLCIQLFFLSSYFFPLTKREKEGQGGREVGGAHAQADPWSYLMCHSNFVSLSSF